MPRKIFLAILAYDFKVDAGTCLSIVQNVRYLERKGIEPELHFEVGSCYLPLARNNCVHAFLASDCESMVFIDSDLIFGLNAIHKLVTAGVDMVAGVPPYKTPQLDFPVGIFTENNKAVVRNDLISASYVPTGLLLISRNCINMMMIKYPETKLADGKFYLFDTGDLWQSKVWTGEDIVFCNRWREIGGKIWIVPDINFGHTVRKEYTGNLKNFLEKEGKL